MEQLDHRAAPESGAVFFRRMVKLFLFFVFLFMSTDNFSQQLKEGDWIGTILENGNVFTYTLKIKSIQGNLINGQSISSSSNFNCTTSFSGSRENGRIKIEEQKIISTNYPKRDEICLMTMYLTFNKDLLVGEFVSSNGIKKNCGKGVVSLKFKEPNQLPRETKPKEIGSRVNDTLTAPRVVKKLLTLESAQNRASDDTLFKIDGSKIKVPVTSSKKERDAVISNVIYVPSDSVQVELYDNGLIDGDVVSLIINDQVYMKDKELTDRPVVFSLNNKNSTEFVIEFFAENLGSVPPNTGLIVIKNSVFRKELTFSSDFSKSNAIKIVFNSKTN